jgi:hypothetical protein
MNLSQLKPYYDKSLKELNDCKGIMSEIYTHAMGNKNTWNGNLNAGTRTDLNIYNSRPQNSTKQFADNLVSLMIPNGVKFIELTTDDKISEDDTFLQDIEVVNNKIFEKIGSSNFYQVIYESFLDLTAGTGGFSINYDKDRHDLYFTSLDMSKVAFLEDKFGRISYVFRNLGNIDKISQQIMFPDITFDTSQIELLECVYPEGSGFTYVITDTSFSKVYKKEYSKANPFIIFRWAKRSGENRGFGILHNLIGLMKMTNIMAMDIIDATALVISPPVVASSNSLFNPNNLKIEPNSIITIDNVDGIKQFPTNPNLPFGYQAIEQNNTEIDLAFMTNSLGAVTSKEMTATEVNARLQSASNGLGAAFNRIQYEMLSPFTDRIVELLSTYGDITLISHGSKKIKYKYSSPILNLDKNIRLQRLMQSIQSTVQATGDLSYVASAYKLTDFARYSAKALGADLSMLRTQDEIDALFKQYAQAKLSMQQQQINPALNQPVNLGGVPNVQ